VYIKTCTGDIADVVDPASPPIAPAIATRRKGQNIVKINGRTYFELRSGRDKQLSGLSLQCENPLHGLDCAKDCHGIKTGKLTVVEVARRLDIWDLEGYAAEVPDKASHIKLGGRLLSHYQ
jgi:hypothetical protein